MNNSPVPSEIVLFNPLWSGKIIDGNKRVNYDSN